MKINRKRAAFSLIEIMIVVAILADLVLIALPGFLRARRQAQNSRFASDLRLMSSAFEMYAADNNRYPADAALGVLPPGMETYIHGVNWTAVNTIGGRWDWDFNQGYARAAVCVETTTDHDTLQMVAIDNLIDNGVLATGAFRERTANRRWAYIIE